MKIIRLNQEESEIVDNPADIPLLEILKGMSIEELKEFDAYRPTNMCHYTRKQNSWLEREKYLIQNREGHEDVVTSGELVEDMLKNHNAEKFKAWYVLKYSHMVEANPSFRQSL